MQLSRGLAAAGLLACLSACSGPPATAVTTPVVTTRTTATPRTTSVAPTPAFVTPAKITAACPFVTVPDIMQAVGGAWAATAIEKPSQGGSFLCTYQSKFHNAAAFQLRILVPSGKTPRAVTDQVAKTCRTPAVAIPDAGNSAYYCNGPDQDIDGLPEQQTRVFVAKTSHDGTRAGILDLHRIRESVYVNLAQLLGERL
ncbi:hypothetical protein ACIOD2_44350 [Amycolatopsis sp. NPDC088138]|uniref:hypothetical protein n=1 Tax=Amycolatopsis sp. NPDC088138 TaxID=3363938 RepID=UPI003815474F